MAQSHSIDISLNPPACPDCKKTMWMQRTWPDPDYPNVRHVVFICDCGRASDQMVADTEPTHDQRCLQKTDEAVSISVQHLKQMRESRRQYSSAEKRSRAAIDESYRRIGDNAD